MEKEMNLKIIQSIINRLPNSLVYTQGGTGEKIEKIIVMVKISDDVDVTLENITDFIIYIKKAINKEYKHIKIDCTIDSNKCEYLIFTKVNVKDDNEFTSANIKNKLKSFFTRYVENNYEDEKITEKDIEKASKMNPVLKTLGDIDLSYDSVYKRVKAFISIAQEKITRAILDGELLIPKSDAKCEVTIPITGDDLAKKGIRYLFMEKTLDFFKNFVDLLSIPNVKLKTIEGNSSKGFKLINLIFTYDPKASVTYVNINNVKEKKESVKCIDCVQCNCEKPLKLTKQESTETGTTDASEEIRDYFNIEDIVFTLDKNVENYIGKLDGFNSFCDLISRKMKNEYEIIRAKEMKIGCKIKISDDEIKECTNELFIKEYLEKMKVELNTRGIELMYGSIGFGYEIDILKTIKDVKF